MTEFKFRVLDNANRPCGDRRTEADAVALKERLEVTVPVKAPYRVVEVTQ